MGDEIIYLNVSDDAAGYACRFGAKRNATGQWFVVGLVPRELLNFLPRQPNPLFYERELPCPRCGALTRKVQTKIGGLLWVCTARNRTGCDGIIRYEDYLQEVDPITTLGDFLPQLGTLLLPAAPPEEPNKISKPENQHPLRERWIALVQQAFEIIGDGRRVMLWLDQPKVALGLKTPMQMLGSVEGCAAVARLLDELQI